MEILLKVLSHFAPAVCLEHETVCVINSLLKTAKFNLNSQQHGRVVIVIDTVAVQSLLGPFCCVFKN